MTWIKLIHGWFCFQYHQLPGVEAASYHGKSVKTGKEM